MGSQFNYKIYHWVSGFSDFKQKKEDERENHKPIFKLCSVYPFVATVSIIVIRFSFDNMKDDLQSTRQAAASACEPVILASGHTGLG